MIPGFSPTLHEQKVSAQQAAAQTADDLCLCTTVYESHNIEGWAVEIEQGLLERVPDFLPAFTEDVQYIKDRVPAAALSIIMRAKFFVNDCLVYGTKSNPVVGTTFSVCLFFVCWFASCMVHFVVFVQVVALVSTPMQTG